MDKQEILEAFKKAEIDWSKPIQDCLKDHTDKGLCSYFRKKMYSDIQITTLSTYWQEYKTTTFNLWDFYSRGLSFLGKEERLDAIRKVIKDLENE